MSRALLLKRHIIERESELLDFAAKVKRDFFELRKSDSGEPRGYQPYYLLEPADPYGDVSVPLDLSVKSSTPITPPSTPSPCLSGRKCKEESPTTRRKAKAKKQKANRKLNFDEDKSSPVSGTIIRDRSELGLVVQKGDIDPMYNVVEVTEEAKAELAKIENRIGDYVCKLCHQMYQDAFTLAQHRCSCIIHVEYKCPECEKVFNCPANLASHRRWHKPKAAASKSEPKPEPEYDSEEGELHIPCPICGQVFRQQTALREHLAGHHMAELQHSLRPAPATPFAFHHIAAN